MPSVETKIWLALRNHLQKLPLAMPVAWPGEIYRPEGLTPYLRVAHVVGSPVRQTIHSGGKHLRTGRLIVSIVYPLSEMQKFDVYIDIQGRISRHFADGTQMNYEDVCVAVIDYPQAQEGYSDNGWFTSPVNISWRCFA